MEWSLVLMLCLFAAFADSGFAQGDVDPCEAKKHKHFPNDRLGSRNERCNLGDELPLCDYYLQDDWYIVERSVILSHCPKSGSCGVAYPAWMNGTFPNIGDGVVHRNVCIKRKDECCDEQLPIKIKNCTSRFVYYFVHLPECSNAYCFDSNYSCDEPKPPTTTTLSTSRQPSGIGKGKDDNTKYIYIGVGIGLGVAGVAAVIGAAVYVMKSERFKRCRRVSSISNEEAKFPDSPPPYEHVVANNNGKKIMAG